jgi:purine-nucleoside phosphorylase
MKKSRAKTDTETSARKVQASAKSLRSLTKLRPKVAVILGSGLGDFAESVDVVASTETSAIPHYPRSTVQGHRGRIVFGKLGKTPLLLFQGRVHFYETGKIETVLHPIRVARELGISTLVVTNAAGGVDKSFNAGDLMVIDDQVNLTFEAPWAQTRSPRSELYDPRLRKLLDEVARDLGIPVQHGVYCGVKGPCYETAAEIEMVRDMGASAVGMSTVNEVSVAAQLGMTVAGISCITNLATGMTGEKLTHEEVTAVGDRVRETFRNLLAAFIQRLPGVK